MKRKVILPRNEMRGEITECYFFTKLLLKMFRVFGCLVLRSPLCINFLETTLFWKMQNKLPRMWFFLNTVPEFFLFSWEPDPEIPRPCTPCRCWSHRHWKSNKTGLAYTGNENTGLVRYSKGKNSPGWGMVWILNETLFKMAWIAFENWKFCGQHVSEWCLKSGQKVLFLDTKTS